MTIIELNDFYLSCIQGSRVLPIFVRNMKIQPKQAAEMEKQANEYFGKLLHIYEGLKPEDKSLVSLSVNTFNDSFASMIGKFKKAGINISYVVPNKCVIKEEAIQDFIQIPEKDKLFLPPDIWSTKEESIFSDTVRNPIVAHGKIALDKESFEISNEISIPSIGEPKDKESIKLEESDEEASNAEELQFIRIISAEQIKIAQESDDDEDKSSDEFESDDNDSDKEEKVPQKAVVISIDDMKSKTIKSEQFDGMVSQFTEKDGIERAIVRMREMSKSSKLKIQLASVHNFDRKYLNPDNKNISQKQFSVLPLIEQSYFFSQELIKSASEQEVPFSNIAVNILVDCSSFISDENKVFNMMIVCALTNALTALKIPYSAAVIADQNFRCVIKPFEEPHSYIALQRICDCLLIKRYRTKLASSVKFAIDSMAYTIDSTRQNRAIFTFSDRLDEQLVPTNSWAESILTDEKLSFGFFFIKSSQLINENLAFVENVWREFETETKDNGAKSNLKVASIKAEISPEITKEICELFATVMKRNEEPSSDVHDISYAPVNFSLEHVDLSSLQNFNEYMKPDYQAIKGVYAERTDVLNSATSVIDKLDVSKYRNQLMKVSSCHVDDKLKKDDVATFLKGFIENRRKLNQATLETIFKPNKASQTVLSTTGTDFDITALILNLINPVPDPLIYLEEKGGLIRNYGVSVVIDPSISCFHELSGAHSFQTIRNVLSSLAALDLPCFDLIVAGTSSPNVLCSEVGTLRALNFKSQLWESLFAVLQTPSPKVDLASAIHAAFDLRRMRSTEYSSILLVLTDRLYQKSERTNIVKCVNNCVQSGMNTICIGIGIYPKGIEKMFPQVVFSPNPSSVMKGVASFFGDNLSDSINKMPSITIVQNDPAELQEAIKNILSSKDTPVFGALKNELHKIMPALDAFDDLYNEEHEVYDDKEGFKNPTGKNTELYVKNCLKTQKILIVMLWDHTLSKSEEDFVAKEYIFKSSKPGRTECIKTAVDHYGIELVVKQNYKDAIIELTKQTKPGYCDYYAVWVMCGPPFEILPDRDSDPNLVGQFNQVLIQFWKKGGSLVFWAEGEPLTYQVNLFLEEVTFENEVDCPTGKTKLRIEGEHEGKGTLFGDDSDVLSKKKTFNRSPLLFKQCQRTLLSHNIGKIFEGITISYAPYDLALMKPFKPFSRDSEGGISSLFYCANPLTGTGDIVIDCGYTKCFTQMTSDGTFRYIQNIAGWTARPEVHLALDRGIQPCDWRPKAVEFKIQEGIKWDKFEKMPSQGVDIKGLKTLWAIDCSGSVGGQSLYHTELAKIVDEYYKPGDDIWLWDDSIDHINIDRLRTFMRNREGRGGTYSELIAKIAIQSGMREHLLIVTDGYVGSGSIDESDNLMRRNNIQFKAVTTFIIGRGGNLSVGAPYSRGCPNEAFVIRDYNSREKLTSLTPQDIAALNSIGRISTYSQFISNYSNLDTAIQAKMLGTTEDSTLQSQLRSLQQRVTNNGMSSYQQTDFNQKITSLIKMASGALRNSFTLNDIAAAKKV